MREQLTSPHERPPEPLTKPLLFLSSETTNWGDNLIVRAFHEPSELHEWSDAVAPQIAIIILSRGAMQMERRVKPQIWKSFTIQQGDLFLVPGGGSPYESSWQSLTPEPMQTIHLLLQPSLIARVAEEIADYDPARLIFNGKIGFQDPLLTHIGLTLWQELEQQSPASKLYAETATQLLAVHLLRHYTSINNRVKEITQGLNQRQVKRVTDFVLAHLNQDLSLDALAHEVGFSSYHFSRLFRQTTGQSPHQFVLQKRIENAQYLLQKTDTPLIEIALASGFANQSHLTQVFKRQLGFTPRAYRQNQ